MNLQPGPYDTPPEQLSASPLITADDVNPDGYKLDAKTVYPLVGLIVDVMKLAGVVPGNGGPQPPTPPQHVIPAEYVYREKDENPESNGIVSANHSDLSQARLLLLSSVSSGGLDMRIILDEIGAGANIVIQDKDNSAAYYKFLVLATPTRMGDIGQLGAYYSILVSHVDGPLEPIEPGVTCIVVIRT